MKLPNKIFQTKFPNKISKQNFQTKFPNEISKQSFQIKFPNKISKWNYQTKFPNGISVWKIHLEIPFGNSVWIFRLEISFGNFVWKTERPTDRATLEAPSQSLKITHTHTPSMESNSPLERSSLKIDTFHLLFWPISPHIPNFRHIFTLFFNSKV